MRFILRLLRLLFRGNRGRRSGRAGRQDRTASIESDPRRPIRALSSARLPAGLVPVNPLETDPALSDWLEAHLVAKPAQNTTPTGQLVLFLCGSHGHPGRQTAILQAAAAAGHHAINLTYPNSWTVGGLCRKSSDPDAHFKVRRDIIEGTHTTNILTIPPADSILNRLIRLLQWLETHQPGENWGQFLADDAPVWEKMVLAGHSQGGGHVAVMAKLHPVAKVIMLGAPSDYSATTRRPASWLYGEKATPSERYFGFSHLRDQGIAQIEAAWELLGMKTLGPVINVDQEPSPYHQSHCLVSGRDTPRGKFHSSVATDGTTPRNAVGQPVYRPVWDYLFRA